MGISFQNCRMHPSVNSIKVKRDYLYAFNPKISFPATMYATEPTGILGKIILSWVIHGKVMKDLSKKMIVGIRWRKYVVKEEKERN